jgi:hypothetical protein
VAPLDKPWFCHPSRYVLKILNFDPEYLKGVSSFQPLDEKIPV